MTYEKAFGTQFQIGDGALASTPSYTTIAQVKSVGDWAIEQILADVTHHSSTAGFREVFPSGRRNVDDIDIELGYDPANATHANSAGGLMHALLNETKLAYKIIFPDTNSTTWTFEAYVKKIGTMVEQEEELRQTVTFAITGQPTLT